MLSSVLFLVYAPSVGKVPAQGQSLYSYPKQCCAQYLVRGFFICRKSVAKVKESGEWWWKNLKKHLKIIEKWWKVVYNVTTLILE